jgi:dihydroflavonol-4-reductase
MRVMMTGATGFLGGHVLEQLRARDVEITALVRSAESAQALAAEGVDAVVGALDDVEALRRALKPGTDCIFHIAADTSTWRGNDQRQSRTNVEGTRSLLRAASQFGVRRFVHTSSVSAFGQQEAVINESSPRLGAQSWINYERSKAIAERLVFEADARGEIETVVLNPAHILGPGDRHNWARLFLMVDQDALPGVPPGSGAFADVREVARAHIRAWQLAKRGEQFLLGGTHASFLELVSEMAVNLGKSAPGKPLPAWLLASIARVFDTVSLLTRREPRLTPQSVSMTCHHLRVDSSKAIRELDYRIAPLDKLVKDTCDWLRAQGMLSR